MTIEERNSDGTLKSRSCADGRPQQKYTSKKKQVHYVLTGGDAIICKGFRGKGMRS